MAIITDARKLSTEQQELLRQQAIKLREKVKTFQEIGVLLNVHPDTDGRWYKRYQEGGKKALIVGKRGPKDKPRRLTCAQEQRVIEAIRDNNSSLALRSGRGVRPHS